MITFITSTALPIEAATTMGVSVKDDGAIGKFGTGLKYAIAGILRLNGTINITIDGLLHDFTAKESDIRGKTFHIIHCNGVPCGFTTELGKHWEPWMLFRELASNTLDEGGSWTYDYIGEGGQGTIIRVNCREVSDAEKGQKVFLSAKNKLIESTSGATVYEGASKHYYFRGIRAGSFACLAPVTIDVDSGNLSEDRMLDLSTVRTELAWAFRNATKWDQQLVLSAVHTAESGNFWVDNIASYQLGELPNDMLTFLAERPKFVKNKAFKSVLDKYRKDSGKGKWTPVEMTARHLELVADGERVADNVGVDRIPRDRIRFTTDLGDDALAVTCMDTREVWFSTELAMLGRDEFVCGYIEEAIHAMTGQHDCTRGMQNVLFSIITAIGSR